LIVDRLPASRKNEPVDGLYFVSSSLLDYHREENHPGKYQQAFNKVAALGANGRPVNLSLDYFLGYPDDLAVDLPKFIYNGNL
jgi:hypothetical protein